MTERESQLADALHRIVDRCTWRLSKKPSKRREGAEITLENIHEIATEVLRSPLAGVPSAGTEHVWEWRQTPENKYVGRYICAVCGQQQSKQIRTACPGPSHTAYPVCVCGHESRVHLKLRGFCGDCGYEKCKEFRSVSDVVHAWEAGVEFEATDAEADAFFTALADFVHEPRFGYLADPSVHMQRSRDSAEADFAALFDEAFDMLYAAQWLDVKDGASAPRLRREWFKRVAAWCNVNERIRRRAEVSADTADEGQD